MYNMENDPAEAHNLIEKEYPKALRLKEILFDWFNSFSRADNKEDPLEINEKIKKRLQGLGYY